MSLTSNFRYVINMVSSALRKKANVSDLDIYETKTNVDRKIAKTIDESMIARDSTTIRQGDWYTKGTYVLYNKTLYILTADSKTGPFDPDDSDWERISNIGEALHQLTYDIDNVNSILVTTLVDSNVYRGYLPSSVENGHYYTISGSLLESSSYRPECFYLFKCHATFPGQITPSNFLTYLTPTNIKTALKSIDAGEISYDSSKYVGTAFNGTIGKKVKDLETSIASKQDAIQIRSTYIPVSEWSSNAWYLRTDPNINFTYNDTVIVFAQVRNGESDAIRFNIGETDRDSQGFRIKIEASPKPTDIVDLVVVILKNCLGHNAISVNQ